jgi:hypothetical protein
MEIEIEKILKNMRNLRNMNKKIILNIKLIAIIV